MRCTNADGRGLIKAVEAKIDDCEDCPFLVRDRSVQCTMAGKYIMESEEYPPDWCPLRGEVIVLLAIRLSEGADE